MASIIRVKRSTGTSSPASLQYGELAYTVGVGTFGNLGSRLFIGDTLLNPLVIGGKYFTDLLGVGPGLVANQQNPGTPANGFVAILDENRKVDQWNVDNLRLDGNTLSSQNTDGDIILDPNGSGDIQIPDNTDFVFGDGKDVKIYYDGVSDNRLEITGADWRFNGTVDVTLQSTTPSNGSPTSGALVVNGGVGIGSDLTVGNNVNIFYDLTVGSADPETPSKIETNSLQFDIIDTGAVTGSLFKSASYIVIGSTVGIATIRNATVDLDGDLNIDGGDLTSNLSSFNLLNTNVTTSNILGEGSNITIGATTGNTSIRNSTVQFTNSESGSYVSIAATTSASSPSSGSLRVAGGAGIASDLYVGGSLYVDNDLQIDGDISIDGSLDVNTNLVVDGNTTLGNSSTDSIYITGITTFTGDITQTGFFNNTGGAGIDDVVIQNNVISTKSGTGNTLYIDPYPDGLSNEGTVVIKGDLQVDGTTTSVNSTTVTVDDPILNLGNVYTVRTVMTDAVVGVNTIRLDSVVGINTDDTVVGSASLSPTGLTTITSIDPVNKIISISNGIISGISTGTQLTIQTGYDTNTDRGISFSYNTGIGTGNNKQGFFGYVDSTGNWTYIPDASITNAVVSGVKGTLDVGSLILDWAVAGINTRGAAFFDQTGKLVSTNSPEIGYASTSNYILTTDAFNTPIWTDTLDGGTF